MRSRFTIDAKQIKEIGASLAHAVDDEQAAFFSAFCSELRIVCETHYALGMQLAYIRDKLTKEERECFGHLSDDEV